MVSKKGRRRKGVAIEVRAVHQSYGSRKVLKSIGFRVEPGDFIGLIGPNGSGKTTLLGCMIGSIGIDKGRVKVGGKDVSKIDSLEVAKMVGIVPQRTDMNFEFTVQEVVLMGRYPHIERFSLEDEQDFEVAEDAMRATDTYGLKERLVTNLSGGEVQRVIIARALAQEPKALLLDEPTSHLDIRHQLEILSLIRDLNVKKGLTVVSVFHDLNLAARYCGRVILLKDGRIMADGRPEDVFTSENLEKAFGVITVVTRNDDGRLTIDVGRLAGGSKE